MNRDLLPVIQRFLARVRLDPETGCWVWQGKLDDGYGRFTFEGRIQKAHRVSWLLFLGPLPEAMVVDHVCRNRACVRPDLKHLEPITSRQNTLRGLHSRKHAGSLELFNEDALMGRDRAGALVLRAPSEARSGAVVPCAKACAFGIGSRETQGKDGNW